MHCNRERDANCEGRCFTDYAGTREHPLTLYVFSQDAAFKKKGMTRSFKHCCVYASSNAAQCSIIPKVGLRLLTKSIFTLAVCSFCSRAACRNLEPLLQHMGCPWVVSAPADVRARIPSPKIRHLPACLAGYLSGKFAFDTFTHFRGTMDNPGWVDSLILSGRYPPYTVSPRPISHAREVFPVRGTDVGPRRLLSSSQPKNVAFLRKLFNVSLPPRPGQNTSSGWSFWLVLALLGVASALLTRRQVS